MASGPTWLGSAFGKKKGTSASGPSASAAACSKPQFRSTNKRFQRTASIAQDYVERVVRGSSYLQRTPGDPSIAQLKRSQLTVGTLVGEGSFSQVAEVLGFERFALHNLHENDNTPGTENPQDGNSIKRKTSRGKLLSKWTIKSRTDGRRRYVVKHLHPKLLHHTATTNKGNLSPLDTAACDLVIEALFLSKLQHPHIVAVRGMAEQGASSYVQGYDGFFYVTDYLPTTLEQRILDWHAERLPEFLGKQGNNHASHSMVTYALQLAQALLYLHQRRLIYRDVKPQNVGFSRDDQVQLYDFGMCRQLPNANQSVGDDRYHMTYAGTARYMAGEILLGEAYNGKSDVYSFALVAYEMWTLQPAYPNFDRNNLQDHVHRVCVQAKRPGLKLYQLPPILERLLRKSWMRNVEKRFTMAEVVQELEMYVASVDESPRARNSRG